MLARRLLGFLPASLVSGLTSFAAVFLYTRLMTPAEYGQYALALTALGVVYTLCVTWAEAAAYRFAAEAEARGDMASHIRTSLGLLAGSAALIVGVIALALPFADDGRMPLVFAVMAVAAAMPLVNTAQELNKAAGRSTRYAAIKIVQDVGGFVFGALLAWRGGLGAAAPLVGLACVLAGLALREGVALWRQSRGGAFEPQRIRRYTAYGLPIAFALVLNIALDTGDRVLIAAFLGPEAVGVYAAGYGVIDKTIGLICAWAAMAGAPMMMAAWEAGDRLGLTRASAGLARTLMLAGMPAAVGLALVARPLAEVMIGEAMRAEAARIMPWIALAGLMNGLVLYFFSEAFQLSRRTGLRALLMLGPALFNIVLNAVLLPRLGLMGAVYATLASYALALVLLAGVGRRHVRLAWPWTDTLKIAAACLVMAGLVRALPIWGGLAELMLKAGAGATTYATALVLLDVGGARARLANRLRSRLARA